MNLTNNLNLEIENYSSNENINLNELNILENLVNNLNYSIFLNDFNEFENYKTNTNNKNKFEEENILNIELNSKQNINNDESLLNLSSFSNPLVNKLNKYLNIDYSNLELNNFKINQNLILKVTNNLNLDDNIIEKISDYNLQDKIEILNIKILENNQKITDSKEFSKALIEKIDNLAKTIQFGKSFDTKIAIIRLDPPQLGSIEIIINQNNKGLNIQLQTNNNEVLKQLNNLTENLRQDLQTKNNNEVIVKIQKQEFNYQNFENPNKQKSFNQSDKEEEITNSLLEFNQ